MPRFVPDALIIRIDKFLKETFYRTLVYSEKTIFVCSEFRRQFKNCSLKYFQNLLFAPPTNKSTLT